VVTEAIKTRDEIASVYLQYLENLAEEIFISMEAITSGALPDFQASVAKQEMLCATLASLAGGVDEKVGRARSIDPWIVARIQAKIIAVRELNLHYAALLKHSGRSIDILASLCRSYTGRFQEARGPRQKYQTWSCEM
jgi:hypothetical protein